MRGFSHPIVLLQYATRQIVRTERVRADYPFPENSGRGSVHFPAPREHLRGHLALFRSTQREGGAMGVGRLWCLLRIDGCRFVLPGSYLHFVEIRSKR